MRAPGWIALALAAPGLLAGCTPKVNRVAFDPARLVAQPQAALKCPYRLGEVVDARPSTGRAGGLGRHLFLVEDAAALLTSKLEGIGVARGAEAGDEIDARLLHLYLSQNTITKVPVLVVGVTVADEPALLLRSQQTSMNWNSSEDEAYEAFSIMFDDAMGQLVAKLNARCAAAVRPAPDPALALVGSPHFANPGARP